MALASSCQRGNKDRTITWPGPRFIAREIQKLGSSIQGTTASPAPGKQGRPLRGFPTQFSVDLTFQRESSSRRVKHLLHTAPERDKGLSSFGFQTLPNLFPRGCSFITAHRDLPGFLAGRYLLLQTPDKGDRQAPNTSSRCTHVVPDSSMPRALQSQPCSSSLIRAKCSPSPTLCCS